MAIIGFENLADDGKSAKVPNGYRDLNWNNFIAVDDESLKSEGFDNLIHSGEAAGYNGDQKPAGFRSPDSDADFNLNRGYFTAVNANDLKVKVVGFDDGERVAKQVLTLDTEREFVKFGAQFDDIDEVRFTPRGGTAADPNVPDAFTQSFLMDDLFIDF